MQACLLSGTGWDETILEMVALLFTGKDIYTCTFIEGIKVIDTLRACHLSTLHACMRKLSGSVILFYYSFTVSSTEDSVHIVQEYNMQGYIMQGSQILGNSFILFLL